MNKNIINNECIIKPNIDKNINSYIFIDRWFFLCLKKEIYNNDDNSFFINRCNNIYSIFSK